METVDNKQRLLVVDDEPDICEILRFNLMAEGYEVDTASSAEEALAMADKGRRWHLMLLDVMMERLSGYELLALLRSRGDNTPAIFLTARSSHDDQLRGFDVGADDYVAKPFSFDTVLARVKAVLRRSSGEANGASATPLDASAFAASLTRREFLILKLFQDHPGRYFSREEIVDAVWPDDTCVGARSVDVHIARLRKKMGPQGRLIVGKTGFGYGLV